MSFEGFFFGLMIFVVAIGIIFAIISNDDSAYNHPDFHEDKHKNSFWDL